MGRRNSVVGLLLDAGNGTANENVMLARPGHPVVEGGWRAIEWAHDLSTTTRYLLWLHHVRQYHDYHFPKLWKRKPEAPVYRAFAFAASALDLVRPGAPVSEVHSEYWEERQINWHGAHGRHRLHPPYAHWRMAGS
jgi:hypothetical protein